MTSTLRILSAALCLFALTAGAATYIVPPDAEMIQKSDDIVIATGVRSMTELDARSGIVTRFTLRIDEVLKGDRAAGQELVLTERGGVIGNKAMIIAGTPRYVSGVRYLVFTSANRNLEPVTFGLSLGQFHLVGDLALRAGVHGFNANLDPHAERARNAALFIRYIHSVVTQRKATIDYFAAESAQIAAEAKIATNAFSATSYLMQDNGFGYRWATPAAGWVRAGTASGSGDPVFATATAMAQWNGTGTGINYTDAGF
ncbi:MAG TPA: hypothetical protein VM733_15275, partial [Thermoanaerobaculia bacterium]|nr:hypothetical protein [Thermoanaerobaculia bacterium]